MAKKVSKIVKLQVVAGKANPAPPVGPALGQAGVNIMGFCKEFNARTENVEKGTPLPTVITVYQDKSFTFVTKTPPAAVLIKKECKIEVSMLEWLAVTEIYLMKEDVYYEYGRKNLHS